MKQIETVFNTCPHSRVLLPVDDLELVLCNTIDLFHVCLLHVAHLQHLHAASAEYAACSSPSGDSSAGVLN